MEKAKDTYIIIKQSKCLIFCKDCKLYPLHKICNTLAELLNSGVTKFINLEGKILHWKKDQYFDIYSLAVVHSKVLENNKVELFYKLPEGGLERVVTSK